MLAGIERLLADSTALARAVSASTPSAPFAGRLLADGYGLGAPAGALRRLGQHPRQYVNFGAPAGDSPSAPEQQRLSLPPFAHDQHVATDEDTAVRIDLAAGDELQAALGSYSIESQPAHGRLSGSGRYVTYTPDPDRNGSDSFRFRLRFAVVLPSVGNVTVDVRPVADAPVVTTTAGATAYAESAPPVPVDPGVTVGDVDSPTLTSASAMISGGYVSGQDVLAFADTPSIRGSWHAPTGTLRLSGSASLADYQTALRAITFANTSGDPVDGTRQVSFTASDGALVSAPAAKAVEVSAVNDRPVVTLAGGAVAYTENDPATAIDATLTVADADSPSLAGATVRIAGGLAAAEDVLEATAALPGGITTSYDAATGTLRLIGTASVADYETALRAIGYRNTSDAPSTDDRAVEVVATDTGGESSAVASRAVTVTAVNDGPVASDDAHETDAGTVLNVPAPGVLANDDDADGDPLAVTEVNGSGARVGTAYRTARGATVTLAADGSLSYDPDGQFDGLRPGDEETDTIAYTVADGDGASDTATISVTVSGVNDGPTATDDAYETDEDTVLTVAAPGLLANDSDPDGDSLAIDQVDGDDARVGSAYRTARGATVTVAADGSLSYDPTGAFDALAPGEEATDTVTYRATDGTAGDTATITITIRGLNDRPAASDDAYVTDEDTALTVAAPGLLANDSDPEGDGLVVDQVDGSAANVGTPFRAASGATVSVAADGSLSYDPRGAFDALRPGEEATDTIAYRASDGAAGDTATITITISGVNDAPTGVADSYAGVGNTTLVVSDPAPAGEAAKQLTGFVSDNDTDPDHAAEELSVRAESVATRLGGHATIDGDGSFTYVPPTGSTGDDSFDYEISDGDRSGTGTVTVRLSRRVWYVDNTEAVGGTGRSSDAFDTLAEATAASTAGDTIFVHTGDATTRGMNAGATLDANERLLGEAADLVVDGDRLYDGSAARRPSISNASGVGVALASGSHVEGLAVTATGGAAISGGAGVAGSTLRDLTVSGSGGGVALSGTSGTFTIADTAISTTGGTGLAATGAGTLALTSASLVSVRSTGGRAVDVSGTALSGTIDAIVASGSAGGVALQSTTGSITLGDVAVDVTGGTGFLADGVAGLSLPAAGAVSVRNSGGTAVAVRNSTAPSTTFDAVTASSGSATGIDVSGNRGGGTTTFGGPVTIASGAATGVRLASNGGHAIAFSGGGLGVTSTSGDGFAATGGGTVTVTGAGNVLRSGTGTALRIAGTTIGAADATFQSISANGGANGIVLDQTGAGGLAVTGTGAADSGGTIQNVRGADGTNAGVGVYLNQARDVALTGLRLTNSDGHAIRGTSVDGFALDRSTIDGVHGTNDAVDEGGLLLRDLTGTSSITDTAISGGFEDNAVISSSRGTLALTLDNDTFGANSRDLGGNSVYLLAEGTADVTTSVTRSSFTSSREDLFQHNVTGTAASDFTFDGNTLSNGHPAPLGGSGLLVAASGDGADLTYSITGNRLTDMSGGGIFVQKAVGIAAARGVISGNTIGTAGDVGSGAPIGSGISVESRGQGSHVARVANNTVRQYNQNGIRTVHGEDGPADDGNVDVALTVTGNTVTEPSGNLATAVGFRNEAADPNATVDQCLDFRGNTMVGSAGASGQEVRIRHIATQNVVRLPGYAGGSEDDVAITAFLAANNTLTPARVGVITPGGGAGYVGGAGCAQPTS
nr:Ig-like domain-containing protein [Conexibacter arvalis]